ncbi:hypothetical protein L6164_024048 [Bauhinia variegata]|uniref:Uncharacterized protein n=1 Tax=Bauhinia variegata TaxID=167791 RepID=A0ACB9LX99_BAUVA|nr:hypothetical protein L6164_024048 [Bauhinia variegata]
MAPDDLSSSPPISASTKEESQTHQLSSSQFQLPYSHINAPSPRMLPPQPRPPPSTTNSISGWRRRMPRSRKPMASDDSSSSAPLSASKVGESQTHRSPSSQFQLPYFPGMLLLLLLPPPSTDNSIPGWRTTKPRSRKPMAMAATCHILQSLGVEQDSHTGQDLPQELMDPVSIFLPDHVPCTISRLLLQFAKHDRPRTKGPCFSSKSVSSNDEEAGPAVNNVLQQIQKRVIFSQVLPGENDPEHGIWVAPPRGYFKLNVAVTLCNVDGAYVFGMGAVIRNHSGVARGAMTLVFPDITPPQAESFIYNLGIAFSLYWGYKSLIAETESHLLVDHFQALAHTPGLHFQNFNYFRARRVSRNANGAAQVFAEIAPLQRTKIFWTVRDIRNYFGTNVMRF